MTGELIRVDVSLATDDLERLAAQSLNEFVGTVQTVAQSVHADPEVSYEEHNAARKARNFLRQQGFKVCSVDKLPTAFTASFGTGETTIGLFLEYDALPGIGHACGHHLILGSGLLAAVGLASVAEKSGITIVVFGTPAEEFGGGKIELLERGVFDDVDFALMVHPVPEGTSFDASKVRSLALGRYKATFRGQGAHSSVAPHLARNAADAAVLAQVGVGLLRQQLRAVDKVALFIEQAGEATNIIPAEAIVNFECRSDTVADFKALLDRVRACFEAGAIATGTQLDITATAPEYEPLEQDAALVAAWNRSISKLGYSLEATEHVPAPSTDMGNVSRRLASIHPLVSIPGVTAAQHTADFAIASDSPQAYRVMVDAAVALAWTALDVARNAAGVSS